MHDVFVAFDPAKDDIATLPALVVTALNDSWNDFQVASFTREIGQTNPTSHVKIAGEYDTLVYDLHKVWRIEAIRKDIKELHDSISHGVQAWEDGEDECAMAECDPSDQYCKGEEIEELQNELKTLLVPND